MLISEYWRTLDLMNAEYVCGPHLALALWVLCAVHQHHVKVRDNTVSSNVTLQKDLHQRLKQRSLDFISELVAHEGDGTGI